MATLTPTKSTSRLAEATKFTVRNQGEDGWAVIDPDGREDSGGWDTRAEAWEMAKYEQAERMRYEIESAVANLDRADLVKLAALMEGAGLL